jgi:hypothetical protein
MLPFLALGQAFDPRSKENSPYSKLGLGDMSFQNYTTIGSMGRLSAVFHDAQMMNLQNPASLGFLEVASLEVAMAAKYANLQDANQSVGVWSGNLSYLSLGFSTRNRVNEYLDRKVTPFSWGMNFTLLPYSTVGYGVKILDSVHDTSEVENLFKGEGGIYRLNWGNGVKYKNLAAGINLGYVFGKISDQHKTNFTDIAAAYDVYSEREFSIAGFHWNAGLLYKLPLGKDSISLRKGRYVTFGLTAKSKTKFNTNSSQLEYRQNFAYRDIDTIQAADDLKGSGHLPSEWMFGVMYEKANKVRLGLNYSFAKWSAYSNDAKTDALEDANDFSFGVEYVPDFQSYNNYLKRVRYRFGAFLAKDQRPELNAYGFTFGLGLPVVLPRQAPSYLNLGFEVGQFGNQDKIHETYARIILGLTLNDNTWFFKRKFG